MATLEWDSERVGSVVYSIIDVDVETGEGGHAWAICDHCGWLPLRVAYFVDRFGDGGEVQVIGSKCEAARLPGGGGVTRSLAEEVAWWAARAAEALAHRDEAIRAMRAEGASLRAIAAAAGVSHVKVRDVCRQESAGEEATP